MHDSNPRLLALQALKVVEQGAFADGALHRVLSDPSLQASDRRLLTELVYGIVRQRRSLDTLIDHLAPKPAQEQPPHLRRVLHLGLYQLRYLTQVPASAAVNTTVEAAKASGLKGLAGVVNGILRQYLRLREQGIDPLPLPADPVPRLGVQYSYPDWIIDVWMQQFGVAETEQLCQWCNRAPHLDLRVNPRRATREQVQAALAEVGVSSMPLPGLPQGLRLGDRPGQIPHLPGFAEGWWTVQEASAQWVSLVLDPQPQEVVIDACAAPGGKTTHLAELMDDTGAVWACDRYASRLRKVTENAERLHLHSIRLWSGDSRELTHLTQQGDRVLLDVPCSGLGTLHRHADARWRQSPERVQELVTLQQALLDQAITWVKPGGRLVYATCTLHPAENEQQIQNFLQRHPQWRLVSAKLAGTEPFVQPEGWLKILPHRHDMDGFFMAVLVPGG
jgi:16S rRNA (cytosine967-C5)-methyltransferase